jgi:hypothetical protein
MRNNEPVRRRVYGDLLMSLVVNSPLANIPGDRGSEFIFLTGEEQVKCSVQQFSQFLVVK